MEEEYPHPEATEEARIYLITSFVRKIVSKTSTAGQTFVVLKAIQKTVSEFMRR